MAFTLHLLHMRMRGGGDMAGMPAGMDHAAHMKMMMEQLQAAQSGHHHPGQDDRPDPRPEFSSIKSLTADEVHAYRSEGFYFESPGGSCRDVSRQPGTD